MDRRPNGFTLIELLIVLAVIGVLASIGFVNLPRDAFAVRQAADGLARDIQHARFLAITHNTYTVVHVEPDQNRYRIVDRRTGDDLKVVSLGGDSRTPLARIMSVDVDANDVVFDPRGVGIGLGPQTIVMGSTRSDYTRTIAISQQGRASIR